MEVLKGGIEVDDLFEQVLTAIERLPHQDMVRTIGRFERRLASARILATARVAGSSGDLSVDRRRARTALQDSKRSARSIGGDARRAAAVASNDLLGDHVSAGRITGEGVDALFRAADSQTGEIPADPIDAARGLPPDQTKRMVDAYLEDQIESAAVDERHERQHKARRLRRYRVTDEGARPELTGIGIEGPDEVIDRLWIELNADADNAYRAAGGRSRPGPKHDSVDHRRFDAAIQRLAGGATIGQPASSRPTVVITVGAAGLADADKPHHGTMIDGGPVSERQLTQWAASSDLVGMIVGLDQTPLWMGRSRRNGTAHQFLALAVRDRGCVLYSASISRCDAHHLIPWTAPGKGQTDLDNLALVCQRCHGDLHHRNHTLQWSWSTDKRRRIWTTRPATPSETPAPAPQPMQRE